MYTYIPNLTSLILQLQQLQLILLRFFMVHIMTINNHQHKTYLNSSLQQDKIHQQRNSSHNNTNHKHRQQQASRYHLNQHNHSQYDPNSKQEHRIHQQRMNHHHNIQDQEQDQQQEQPNQEDHRNNLQVDTINLLDKYQVNNNVVFYTIQDLLLLWHNHQYQPYHNNNFLYQDTKYQIQYNLHNNSQGTSYLVDNIHYSPYQDHLRYYTLLL